MIKAYICNMNHCEILNMIERVLETFYCEVEGFKQIKIVCAKARTNNIMMILLFYGDLSSVTNDMLYENSLTWIGTVISSSLLLCISLYPYYKTNTSISIERSNLTKSY